MLGFLDLEFSRSTVSELYELEMLINFAFDREKTWKKGPRMFVDELKVSLLHLSSFTSFLYRNYICHSF